MMVDVHRLCLLLLACAACDDGAAPKVAPGAAPPAAASPSGQPRLVSAALPKEIEKIVIDGNAADAGWAKATELIVPLRGDGPAQVAIRSVHNDRYAYFLLLWRDEKIDRGNVCRYEEPGVWKMHEGEDAAVLLFPPVALSAEFRARGFSTFVEDDAFAHPGQAGFADLWYWGAQTTEPLVRARDHWLQPGQRLRGDSQPEESDNVLNWSAEYSGPAGVPIRVRPESAWYLPVENAQVLDAVKMGRMRKETNFGWTVSAVLARPIAGSRGDVFAHARHTGGVWIVEIARLLDTGHQDDHPLGVSTLFAVGIYDGTGKGARIGEYGTKAAVSGAIELDFLSPE